MGTTGIKWADKTLNFYTWNCSKVSPGCKFCYAASMSKQYKGQSSNGGNFLKHSPVWRENAMTEYKRLKSGEVVFVNSMSDTYHEGVPFEYILRIHQLAAQRPDVIFLLLTKRPERALELSPRLPYPKNLWIGTSVESKDYLHRLDSLLQIPANGHFLSAEPLIDSVYGLEPYLYPTEHRAKLDWVIVGGESGPVRRDLNTQWALDIRDWCNHAQVSFMFKQGSSFYPGKDRLLEGREWNETPFAEAPIEVKKVSYQLSMF